MTSAAYEAAKAGGRNQGIIRRFGNENEAVIRKSIRSLEKMIAEHQDKIANPWNYVEKDISPSHLADLIARYWPKEIMGFQEQIDVLNGILEDRHRGNAN